MCQTRNMWGIYCFYQFLVDDDYEMEIAYFCKTSGIIKFDKNHVELSEKIV